jgi:hypothetical protein
MPGSQRATDYVEDGPSVGLIGCKKSTPSDARANLGPALPMPKHNPSSKRQNNGSAARIELATATTLKSHHTPRPSGHHTIIGRISSIITLLFLPKGIGNGNTSQQNKPSFSIDDFNPWGKTRTKELIVCHKSSLLPKWGVC